MKMKIKGNIWDFLSQVDYDEEKWSPSQDRILLAKGKLSSYPWDEMAIKFDRSPSACFGRYQELMTPKEEQESIEEEEKEVIRPPSCEPTMSTSKRTSAIKSMERLKRRRISRSQSGDRLAPAVASSSPCSKAVQINYLEGKVTKLEAEKRNLSARLKVAEDKVRQLEVQAQLRVEKDQVARVQEEFNGVSDKLAVQTFNAEEVVVAVGGGPVDIYKDDSFLKPRTKQG